MANLSEAAADYTGTDRAHLTAESLGNVLVTRRGCRCWWQVDSDGEQNQFKPHQSAEKLGKIVRPLSFPANAAAGTNGAMPSAVRPPVGGGFFPLSGLGSHD